MKEKYKIGCEERKRFARLDVVNLTLIKNFGTIYVDVCVHEEAPAQRRRRLRSPGPGVPGGCELLEVTAGNLTLAPARIANI